VGASGEESLTSARRPGGVEVIVDQPIRQIPRNHREASQERSLRAPRAYSAPRRLAVGPPSQHAGCGGSEQQQNLWNSAGTGISDSVTSSAAASSIAASASATSSCAKKPPRGPPPAPGYGGGHDEACRIPGARLRSGSAGLRSRPGTGASSGSASSVVPAVGESIPRRSSSAGPAGPAERRRRPSSSGGGSGVQSNRKLVRNALERYCLKGDANRGQREQILQAFDTELRGYERFIILFRSIHTGRHDLRALYAYRDGAWVRVVQALPSPPLLEERMVAQCLRYDSGGKEFKEVPALQELLNVADAVFLHPQHLQRSRVVVQ